MLLKSSGTGMQENMGKEQHTLKHSLKNRTAWKKQKGRSIIYCRRMQGMHRQLQKHARLLSTFHCKNCMLQDTIYHSQ